ncbi:MAG TPA: methyltransferase domain-containing protein [Vicinamibacterales bacterium]|nr:methyltransferase domain-containing protein [Vicinamibacterales bacterium]
MDPLAGTPWSSTSTVDGFARTEPNRVLIDYATHLVHPDRPARAVDIGCGAGRNALPLARLGWHVLGTDLSRPMLRAAAARVRSADLTGRLHLAMAPMESLPIADGSADLIVAHGIWNLARSSTQMRQAIREAARIARPGAALFVFTFARHTLGPEAAPLPGETFVFSQFSGSPQCFLTAHQLRDEMADAGFAPDPAVPLTEYPRPTPGMLRPITSPVIYEAAFRFQERTA